MRRESLSQQDTKSTLRTALVGAVVTAIAIPVSGPIGLVVVNAVGPAPTWSGAETFVRHYHPVQTFPFFAGFGLLLGYSMTMAALYRLADEHLKTRALIGVMFTTAFVALIFFNYINQTTFVPGLSRDYRPEYGPIITALTMANPQSLAWGIEMWGYALLGVATWFMSPVFHGRIIERATSALMVANGVISIAGGVATAWYPAWVLTSVGTLGYLSWNLLVFALAITMIAALRKREHGLPLNAPGRS